MDLTIHHYMKLLELLRICEYEFCSYEDYNNYKKSVILRHDVDFSLEKALEMAKLEHSMNVTSTYFILVTSDFYNIFSKQSSELIQEILLLNHTIGLHFDEKRYNIESIDEIEQLVEKEAKLLETVTNQPVKMVSMHRPSKLILENNLQFKHLINTYSTTYFKEMKYISDSRLHWRENPVETITSGNFLKLHILTHPFSYSECTMTMEQKFQQFLLEAVQERYNSINENFTDFESVISRSFIEQFIAEKEMQIG